MKQYKYTIYKQDGTIEVLPISKKKDFNELYKILNCNTIEIIPRAYYPTGLEFTTFRGTFYGDEEARFNNKNIRNPHMQVLKGPVTSDGYEEWDVVGDVIKEEVAK